MAALKSRGQGRRRMLSDLIDEYKRFLAITDVDDEQGKQTFCDLQQKTHKVLKHDAEFEGYWNSNKFLRTTTESCN